MRNDPLPLHLLQPPGRALDEAEDGVVGAAGFEGADFLVVFAFEEEAEFGRVGFVGEGVGDEGVDEGGG